VTPAPPTEPAPVLVGGIAALLLLAAALLILGGRPGQARLRDLRSALADAAGPVPTLRRSWVIVGTIAVATLAWAVAGVAAGVIAGAAGGLLGVLALRRSAAGGPADAAADGDLAGSWELLAVCLEAGLPVAIALAAAFEPLAGPAGSHLRRVAGLLALGADPAAAWASTEDQPALAAFARAAGRSAGTGAALAAVARTEGTRLRAELLDSAQARAQRAAVLITGPLGLCFLPAFLVLGITPVVIGLATGALAQW
jgi:Flp pilus assembly protein TadB